MERQRHLPLILLIVAAAAVLWLRPLSSSLWLDELDTYFAAKDGVWTAIVRTGYVHPQCSQLYNAIVAMWIRIVGADEIVLRVPSVVAMSLAAYLVYRLGRLLFDRETGLLAALVFVTGRDVIFAAGDARSYAMATAALIAATELWLRFLSPPSLFVPTSERAGSRRVFGVGYAVTAALTVYFHQLFGLALVVHVLLALWLYRQADLRASPKQILGALVGVAVIAAGEIPNLYATFVGRERMVHAATPPIEYLAYLWAVPMFVVALIPVILLIRSHRLDAVYRAPEGSPLSRVLLVTWAVFPPLVLFIVSRTGETQVFLPRYYLSCQPALAIILGAVLRGFEPRAVRRIAFVSVTAVALLLHSRSHHGLEDWRGVAQSVNALVDENTPVLVDAGFVEASYETWARLPASDDRHRFLLAPVAYYPLHGQVELLPYALNEGTRSYMEESVIPKLMAVERFVAVGRGRRPRWWRGWLDGRFASAGYRAQPLHDGQYLEATLFVRDPAASAPQKTRRLRQRTTEPRSDDSVEPAPRP
jgi:mannosyltransferase